VLDLSEVWTYTGTYTVQQSDLDSNGGGDGTIDNTVTADTTQTTALSASANVAVEGRASRLPKPRRSRVAPPIAPARSSPIPSTSRTTAIPRRPTRS
jgi:hypothetical protein